MANTPRRRSQGSDTAAISTPNSYCCRCGRAYSRKKGYFPVSHSPMYRGSGYLPWCNECIEDMYDAYVHELGDGRSAMRRMCMKMDLYWSDSIYDMVERSSGTNSRVRNYIGKTNIIRYIDKTFDDTIKEESATGAWPPSSLPPARGNNPSGESDDDIPTDQSIIDFWGAGFQHDFYMDLERRYKNWTGGEEKAKNLPHAERALYQQICMQEAIISREAAAGNATDKAVNTLNNLLGSMNLKPAQRKENTDLELEKMPLGVGIQKWEYSRPLPETPKENRDIRGVVKNITTWYLGHACKMVGLKNSYCKAYEDAMEGLRVKRPEYDEEDDDSMLSDIFDGVKSGGDEQ